MVECAPASLRPRGRLAADGPNRLQGGLHLDNRSARLLLNCGAPSMPLAKSGLKPAGAKGDRPQGWVFPRARPRRLLKERPDVGGHRGAPPILPATPTHDDSLGAPKGQEGGLPPQSDASESWITAPHG